MPNLYEELVDTSRRMLLAELCEGPKSVQELCRKTGLKQPNASNHLARLRARGVVSAEKKGRQVFYRLATPVIDSIVRSVLEGNPARETDVDFHASVRPYAEAAVAADEETCNRLLNDAFSAGASLTDVCQDLLTPAMALVGEWWRSGRIDEGQEHFATAVTERAIARISTITGPTRQNGYVAILGCAPGSMHTVGLRMIADHLRLAGWRTMFLGANVPTAAFLQADVTHRPDLVLLSCAADESVDATLDIVRRLSDGGDRSVGVGGPAAQRSEEEFLSAGASFVMSDLRRFMREVVPTLTEKPPRSREASRLIQGN